MKHQEFRALWSGQRRKIRNLALALVQQLGEAEGLIGEYEEEGGSFAQADLLATALQLWDKLNIHSEAALDAINELQELNHTPRKYRERMSKKAKPKAKARRKKK